MQKPGPATYTKWYESLPARDYTCTTCGTTGTKTYVQPIHPYWAGGREDTAQCWKCRNSSILEQRAARKAQLAAMPRCEVPNCNARGAWRSLGVLLCTKHLRRAQNAHQRLAGTMPWLPPDYSREQLLEIARTG